eukprot:gene6378-7387_t
MLDHGGNPNLKLMDDVGESLLHVSCLQNNIDMTRLLLGSGSLINILDCFEATPLDYALSAVVQPDLIKLLKSKGAVEGKGRKM